MDVLKMFRYAMAGWLPCGRRHCAICDHRVWRFMPYRSGSSGVPRLMYALETVGSDPDRFECPRCGAHDRERHLLLYLRRSGVLAQLQGKSLLHFAPERRLSAYIRSAGLSHYVPCDLFPRDAKIQRVDMLDMPFEASTFDAVIANHVLEHVDDDARALAEIHRVIKPGGIAILQTPYSSRLHDTWQDAGIDTPDARLQAYGQEDHVRLFGRDIFDRIAAAGFESQVREHAELLDDVDPATAGVNAAEPFFLFRKHG
jgi:SAM-dependent methyltransferase